MIQRFRHRDRANGGDARQKDGHSADVGHGIVQQLIHVQARQPLNLRNDLVGSRVHAEVIDVVAAEQRPQRIADLGHAQTELRGLVAVDLDHGLRQVESQVGIEEDEHAALGGRGEEFVRNLVEACRRLGRGDRELDGQAERSRQ